MRVSVSILAILIVMSFVACQQDKTESVDIKTKKDTLSYAIGQEIGANLKAQGFEIDMDILSAALRTAFTDTSTLLTSEAARNAIVDYQTDMYMKKQEEMKLQGEVNKKKGDIFLAQNGKKEGVVTTESGLQYKVITAGKGKTPADNNTVTVNYRGRLLDGTEFDSSYKRNKPATFNVNRVIKGWIEALKLMKEGAKWELYVPSDLAYGATGNNQNVGPGETLIFEIELIKVDEKVTK